MGLAFDATRRMALRALALAAQGVPSEWHFAEQAAANLVRTQLREAGITGIRVFWTP
jgi:hypothetical protein